MQKAENSQSREDSLVTSQTVKTEMVKFWACLNPQLQDLKDKAAGHA